MILCLQFVTVQSLFDEIHFVDTSALAFLFMVLLQVITSLIEMSEQAG